MHARILVGFIALALGCAAAAPAGAGDLLYAQGKLKGHVYIDRWGQGVFGGSFFDERLLERIPKTWTYAEVDLQEHAFGPLTEIAPLIVRVGKITPLAEEPQSLNVEVGLDAPTIDYGEETTLRIYVENVSNRTIEFHIGACELNITVRRGGTRPGSSVRLNDPFAWMPIGHQHGDWDTGIECIYSLENRTTTSCNLRGPSYWMRPDELTCSLVKPETRDNVPIAPGERFVIPCRIGKKWPINEYELQLCYMRFDQPQEYGAYPRRDTPPLSFDVVDPNRLRTVAFTTPIVDPAGATVGLGYSVVAWSAGALLGGLCLRRRLA
jgi:hypothetical protein